VTGLWAVPVALAKTSCQPLPRKKLRTELQLGVTELCAATLAKDPSGGCAENFHEESKEHDDVLLWPSAEVVGGLKLRTAERESPVGFGDSEMSEEILTRVPGFPAKFVRYWVDSQSGDIADCAIDVQACRRPAAPLPLSLPVAGLALGENGRPCLKSALEYVPPPHTAPAHQAAGRGRGPGLGLAAGELSYFFGN
jgi:hypothetical protein